MEMEPQRRRKRWQAPLSSLAPIGGATDRVPEIIVRRFRDARKHERRMRCAPLDHACPLIWCCRHHGGKRLRPADVTLRNIALAWVLALPAVMMLSGSLYWLFSHLF
jgi:hypothetical protein